MRSVRISSTSRKPLVVISPTRAPLCSRMALEATVVPWRISSIAAPARPVSTNSSLEPVDDRAGVVADARGDLLGVDRAVGAEQHDVGEGAADIDADAVGTACAHSAAPTAERHRRIVPLHLRDARPSRARGVISLAALGRGGRIDRPARGIDDHAVVGRRPSRGDSSSLRTSFSTAAGSRSSGSPQPPAPASTWRKMSPRLMVMVNLRRAAAGSRPAGLR